MIPVDRHYRDLTVALIADLYTERSFLPLWNRSEGFYRDITDGLVRHALPETWALDPVVLLPQAAGTAVPAGDLAQTVAFFDAALLLRTGAMPTGSIWPDWNEGDRPGSGDASLDDLKKSSLLSLSLEPMDFTRALDTFAPRNWIYRELLKAYPASREAILQYSGLPNIPDPATAGVGRPGEVYPYAGAIAAHLVDKGYLQMAPALAASLTTMTQELTIALSAFQRDYGLEPDGVFGPGSWSYLNTNAADRYRSIVINLQRARLLPDKFGDRYLIVNIPTAELYAFDANDFLAFSMPIVHGSAAEETRRTRIFRDIMQEVVFGPYWNVPKGIAAKELIPMAQADWNFFPSNNYEIVDALTPDNGQTFPLSPETASLVADGRFLLRQRPGEGNALGRVKFLFPNKHDIYLHDTPSQAAFESSRRDRSHGCIRVSRPAELGAWVLGPQGWDAMRLAEALATEKQLHFAVTPKINVYITYLTTFPRPSPGGKILLAPARDVYGLDPIDARTLAAVIPWKE